MDDVPPKRKDHSMLKGVGAALTVFLAAAAVLGVVGDYFFVGRKEYTKKEMDDVTFRLETRNSLENLQNSNKQILEGMKSIQINVSSFKTKKKERE